MALLTRKKFDEFTRSILEATGEPDNFVTAIERLNSDFDESRKILANYGEVITADDVEEYEFIPNVDGLTTTEYEERLASLQGEVDRITIENNKIRKDYIDRFYGVPSADNEGGGTNVLHDEEKVGARDVTYSDYIRTVMK